MTDEIEKFAAWLETGTVDHICRLTNAAFNNPGKRRPQFTIPADPERDSDLRATRDVQEAAALIRRLRDERDEARNKALDEAAAEFTGGFHSYQDIRKAILALKTQEPKP